MPNGYLPVSKHIGGSLCVQPSQAWIGQRGRERTQLDNHPLDSRLGGRIGGYPSADFCRSPNERAKLRVICKLVIKYKLTKRTKIVIYEMTNDKPDTSCLQVNLQALAQLPCQGCRFAACYHEGPFKI